MASVVAGHTGGAGGYRGCIRVDGRIVWQCGHYHRNRDLGHPQFGPSARGCSAQVLRYALHPDFVKAMDNYFRSNPWASSADHEAHVYAKETAPVVVSLLPSTP